MQLAGYLAIRCHIFGAGHALVCNAKAEVAQVGIQRRYTAMMCPGHVQAVLIRVVDLQFAFEGR